MVLFIMRNGACRATHDSANVSVSPFLDLCELSTLKCPFDHTIHMLLIYRTSVNISCISLAYFFDIKHKLLNLCPTQCYFCAYASAILRLWELKIQLFQWEVNLTIAITASTSKMRRTLLAKRGINYRLPLTVLLRLTTALKISSNTSTAAQLFAGFTPRPVAHQLHKHASVLLPKAARGIFIGTCTLLEVYKRGTRKKKGTRPLQRANCAQPKERNGSNRTANAPWACVFQHQFHFVTCHVRIFVCQ